jgi:hypothetical protein
MSVLRRYVFDDAKLYQLAQDLYQVLNAVAGGLRWSDNIAPLITFRYDGDLVPIQVRGPQTAPLAVLCLRAVKLTDQSTTESGARVTWSHSGTVLRIHAIDLTSSTEAYDVHLGVLMG